jgi:tetratricopeptide (TPR) repeat protein
MTSTEAKRVGDEAFLQSDFDQAVAAYTVALAAAPLHDRHLRGTLLANRCLARLKLGSNVEAAVADAEEACEMRPRWGKAHLRKGQVRRTAAAGKAGFSLGLTTTSACLQALEACRATNAAAHSYQRAVELDASLEPAAARALAALERHESRNRCLALLQGHQGAIYDAAVHPQVCARIDACILQGKHQLQWSSAHVARLQQLTMPPAPAAP